MERHRLRRRDREGRIECLVCHEKMHQINRHLSVEHHMTVQQYQEQFPGAPIRSDKCETERQKRLKPKPSKVDQYDTDTYVICKECNKKFRRITHKHTKKHGLTLQQYLDKHNLTQMDLISKKTQELNIGKLPGGRKLRLDKIDEDNPDTFVVCRLCDDKFRTLRTGHLVEVHGLTSHQYCKKFTLRSDDLLCKEIFDRGEARRKERARQKAEEEPFYDIGIDPNDPDTYVVCGECDRKMAWISPQHLALHSMTTKEYKKKYPHASRTAKETNTRNVADMKSQINGWKKEGKFKEIESMGAQATNKKRWFGPDRDKNREALSKKLYKHFAEHPRDKWSENAKQLHSELFLKKWEDPEYRKAQVDAIMAADVKKGRRVLYKCRLGETVTMRSSYERAFAIALDLINEEWYYELFRMDYELNSRVHQYALDFYLPKYDKVIEVKSDHYKDDIKLEGKLPLIDLLVDELFLKRINAWNLRFTEAELITFEEAAEIESINRRKLRRSLRK